VTRTRRIPGWIVMLLAALFVAAVGAVIVLAP
jgi:hypothetical protein